MTAPSLVRARAVARPDLPASTAATRLRWATFLPALLVLGALVVAVGVLAAAPGLGTPAAAADADLARLLRAMAAIKGVLVAAGAGVLAWRLRRPAPAPLVLTYLAGVWVASAATASMWALIALGPVAVALHVAGAVLAVAAWRDAGFFAARA